jgi:hypothetical protein
MPAVHYLLAYTVPVVPIGVAIACLVDPNGVVKTLGLKLSQTEPDHSILYWGAIRELSIGIALAALLAYEEWRAATIMLACVGLNGFGDFLLDGAQGEGWTHAFKTHLLPTIAVYWAVWKLCQEV